MATLEGNFYLTRPEHRETLHEYAGNRLSERLVEEFRALDASAYSSISKSKLYVVSTSYEAGLPVSGGVLDMPRFACDWETDLENLLMPKPVLERLSACLTAY
jgi:hypothetical protein